MTMSITLTEHEVIMGSQVGLNRRIRSEFGGLKNNHGYTGKNQWDIDIEGAIAEMIVAKTLGLYWDGSIDVFKRGDINDEVSWIEVRWIDSREKRLIVRPDDPDDRVFILVMGHCPKYRIVGYISGAQAKEVGSLESPNDRPPAYFVTWENLRPFFPTTTLSSLRRVIG